jgi:uncharacterized protein
MSLPFIVFCLLCLFLSVVSSAFGFGSGILILVVGMYVLPEREVVALSAIFFLVAESARVACFRSAARPGWATIFSVVNLPFVVLGALLLGLVPTNVIRVGLALLAIAYVLERRRGFRFRHGCETCLVVLAASLHGLASGLLGSGSTIKAIFFRDLARSREEFVTIMASTGLLASMIKVGLYANAGLLTSDHLSVAAGLALGAVISTFTGAHILRRTPEKPYQDVLNALLLLSAAALVIKIFV